MAAERLYSQIIDQYTLSLTYKFAQLISKSAERLRLSFWNSFSESLPRPKTLCPLRRTQGLTALREAQEDLSMFQLNSSTY